MLIFGGPKPMSDPKDSNFKGQKVQFILPPQKCKIENAVSMRFLSPKKSSNFIFQFRIASGFIFYCGLWYFLRRHHQIYIPWIRGRRKIIAFSVWPTSSKHKHGDADAFHHLIYLLILITSSLNQPLWLLGEFNNEDSWTNKKQSKKSTS